MVKYLIIEMIVPGNFLGLWGTRWGRSYHLAIDKEMWEAVQLEIKRRKDYMEKHGVGQLDFVNVSDNPFTGRVICGHCGNAFGRKTWNSTDENLKRRVWQRNKKYEKKGEVNCKNKHIDEEVLYKAFVSSCNDFVENKEEYIKMESYRWG